MDSLNRREAMGLMAGVAAATTVLPILGTNICVKQTTISLSRYKIFTSRPTWRALYHLTDIVAESGFHHFMLCCDHVDRVKIDILGMKNRFDVSRRKFEADVAYIKTVNEKFENICREQNIVWLKDNGKTESNQMVWMAICLTLSRNLDFIGMANNEAKAWGVTK